MPDGFQTRLIVVALAVLGALYMLAPTILSATCNEWQWGCIEAENTQTAAAPTPSPTRTPDSSLSDPDATPADILNPEEDGGEEASASATPADESSDEAMDEESTEQTEVADATEAETPAPTPEATPEATPETGEGEATETAAKKKDSDDRPFLAKFLPERKLRLGLDLVGGIHLVLDVKTEDTLRLTAENYRRDLTDRLPEEGFDVISVSRPQDSARLVIELADPAAREQVETFVRKKVSRNLVEESFETNEAGHGVLTYGFDEERVNEISEDAVAQVLEILRSRVDEFGVAEPLIYRERGTRVVVQLPGLTDPEAAIRTIKRTARLEFHIVAEKWYNEQGSEQAAQAYLGKITADATQIYGENVTDEQINRYAWKNELIPDDTQIFYQKKYDPVEKETVRLTPWLLRAEIGMLGDQLETARVQSDRFGKPAVGFDMTPEGAVQFGHLTEANVGNRLAVVLEGQLRNAPVIRDKITQRGQITLGSGTDPAAQFKEANEVAQVLRSGALPATVSIEQNWTVGSTLGEDSIRQGMRALGIGGLLVLLFMVFWYKMAGLWADLAVLLSGILLFALMTLFGFTLTLPGIAGIVLTIGMAVDANVLIYERIREELRVGKVPRAAVDAGFNKAFSTVMDANLTTGAAAFVLYYFGTGPIQGFALTLLCGIATTLFGGLVITRLFLEYRAYGRRVERLSI